MRVLVTGSRLFNDRRMVYAALDEVYDKWANARRTLPYPYHRHAFQPYEWNPNQCGYVDGDDDMCGDLSVNHGFDQFVLVHGAAPGADRIANDWAEQRNSEGAHIVIEQHPVNWHNGRGAGLMRNQHMVNMGADVALAFFRTGSANRGTHHCSAMASTKGIPVMPFWSDTQTETVKGL